MPIDKTGGLAKAGNIIFSGNDTEIYTHEIVHIYTHTLFPNVSSFLDEGVATYLCGSGKYDYGWHRDWFAQHLDPFERLNFEGETPIPYRASSHSERTKRIYGNEKLTEMFGSKSQIWDTLIGGANH